MFENNVRTFLAYCASRKPYVSLYTLDLSRKMSGQKLVEYSVNKGKPSQGIGTLGTVFLQLRVLDLVFSTIHYEKKFTKLASFGIK